MYATERQAQIERLVTTAGRASVAELAERLQVTTETIRRDLDRLESIGDVRRVHGGAVAADRGSTTERDLSERSAQDLDAKRAIAVAAAAMVPPRFAGTLLLDAGSTTELVAEKLAARPAAEVAALTVISNSVPVIARLAGNPAIRARRPRRSGPWPHGRRRRPHDDRAAAGHAPRPRLHRYQRRRSAFGLWTPDPDEAAVKRADRRSSSSHDRRRGCRQARCGSCSSRSARRSDELDVLVADSSPARVARHALADADAEVCARMIVTLTANPAIDRTIELSAALAPGDVQTCRAVRRTCGR